MWPVTTRDLLEELAQRHGVATSYTSQSGFTVHVAEDTIAYTLRALGVAILPQPFVSLSKIMVDPLYVPVDITDEWDEEDYFDDFGKTMPEEVKMQNMYLVGKDLYDCFNRMVLEEE